MFGKRKIITSPAGNESNAAAQAPAEKPEIISTPSPEAEDIASAPASEPVPAPAEPAGDLPSIHSTISAEDMAVSAEKGEKFYQAKTNVFNALIETVDLAQLALLEPNQAREEIRDIASEIISVKNLVMSVNEQEILLEDLCNDLLGYGPLEPLLARDDIADIMVNGAGQVYIETGGRIELTPISFRDNGQLMNICQRIVSQVGRRVDE